MSTKLFLTEIFKNKSLAFDFDKSFFDLSLDFTTEIGKTNSGENEKEFFLNLQIPGFSKEDLKITLEGNSLVISADFKDESKNSGYNFYRKEFKRHSFKRIFELPKCISKEGITSKLEN